MATDVEVLRTASEIDGVNAAQMMAGHTNISLAHKAHSDAIEEIRTLNGKLRGSFQRLDKAHEELKKFGVDSSVTFDTPVKHAWNEWVALREVRKPTETARR